MNELIIEKKSEIVDPKRVRIPMNYVLVLPDPHHEFYHNSKGEQLDIQIGKSIMVDVAKDDDLEGKLEERVLNSSQHFSVKGKVFAIPERLNFPKDKIKKLRANFANNDSDMERLGNAVKHTLEWETDIEVEVGDEVIFDYLSHIACYEDGKWIQTEFGDMFLIRYDELHMVIKPDGEKKPINGWVVISRKEKPKETETGLALFHKHEDEISKKAEAVVLQVGSLVKSYKNDFDYGDDPNCNLKEGDEILYRPGGSRPLEWVLHQTLFPGKKALLVHRIDIYYKKENGNV